MPLVRFVGTPSPMFTDPERTRQAIKSGRITEADVWRAEGMRNGAGRPDGRGHYPVTAAIPGTTIFRLSPDIGLSRWYDFGPIEFVQEMTTADWRRLQEATYALEIVTARGVVTQHLPYAALFKREE